MTEKRDTPLNIKLLKKVRDRIAKIPESYDQSWWATRDVEAPCGTTACIAGEALICSQRSKKAGLQLLWDAMPKWKVGSTAQTLLGLTDREADVLFGAGTWPEPFRSEYDQVRYHPKARAKVAVAYLDHIIKTGEVL